MDLIKTVEIQQMIMDQIKLIDEKLSQTKFPENRNPLIQARSTALLALATTVS